MIPSRLHALMLSPTLVLAAALTATLAIVSPLAAQEPPDSDSIAPTPDRTWLVQPAGPLGGADTRSYFEYDLAPGDGLEDVIAVVNHADTPLELSVFGTDAFTSPDDGSFGLLDTDTEPTDVGAWVTLAEEEVTIPAGARMEIPFVVQVPSNATPGDHVGGIVTSYLASATDESGEPVVLDARIAIRIYLTVDGELRPQLAVEELTTDFDLSANQLTGTLTVDYVVVNDGNVRLGADETIRVEGPFGIDLSDVAVASVDEILPGGSVRRQAVFDGVPAAGRLVTRVEATPVDIGGHLTDEELPSARSSSAQFAMPWLWLFVLVVVLYLIRRRRRRWRELKAALENARATPTDVAEPADPDASNLAGVAVGGSATDVAPTERIDPPSDQVDGV